jgi:hypothetical protein
VVVNNESQARPQEDIYAVGIVIWLIACNGRRCAFDSTSNIPQAVIELAKGATQMTGIMTAHEMSVLCFNIHVDFTHFNKNGMLSLFSNTP